MPVTTRSTNAACFLAIAASFFIANPTRAAAPSVILVTLSPATQQDQSAATAAIQSAIDAASDAGGGRVDVPAGTYAVGPLRLRSNVELHLAAGATLLFSRDVADYEMMWIDDGNDYEPGVRSPISAEGATNIAVTGQGVIDGQGDAWRAVQKRKLSPAAWTKLVASGGLTSADGNLWYPNVEVRDGREAIEKLKMVQPRPPLSAYAPHRILFRPNLVRLSHCTNVRLEGVTFRNSASWNVHLTMCENINVQGVTIFNETWAQNGDGIDFDSCRNVSMSDSLVNAGDDAICLKSGKDEPGRRRGRPTENVTISRCKVGTGHGAVVIGSEMSGGVRHVTVTDCVFDGTDNGLRFKSTRGRGGTVEDVTVRNVAMTGIKGTAVLFDLFYAANGKPGAATATPVDTTPAFRNFRLSNIRCDGAKQALLVRGLPEMPLRDIVIEHAELKATAAGQVTDVDGVIFRDVRVTAADGSRVKVQDPKRVTLDGCSGFAQVLPAAKTITVAADGTGDFKTLQDAVAAVPSDSAERTIIHLRAGKYDGQTVVPKSKSNVTFEGEGADQTILTYAFNQNEPNPPGVERRFWGVGVVVLADGFSARDLTFENTSGDHGQAVALRLDGDRAVVTNCRLTGWQDTLRVESGRQYFRECTIAGRVDFIYGSATAVFDRCEIHSRNGGHVTAASTPQDHPYGFVFLDCKLTGDAVAYDFAATNPATTQTARVTPVADLGRPWRPYAAVTFARCELGPHISPRGWSKWVGNHNDETCRYAEYRNTGPGADPSQRIAFARQLTDDDAAKLTIPNILGGADGWDPTAVRP